MSGAELADAAQLASLADETPEGRSIVVLAKQAYSLRGREVSEHEAHFIPFSAYTRMSGVDIDGRRLRKGATDAIVQFVTDKGGEVPPNFIEMSDRISRTGGTPLAVADGDRLLGIVHLKDIVKGGMRERLQQLRAMGIRSVMITGDNPLTAAAIANEAGVDDFLAQATPKDKMEYIKKEQAQGRLVAMTGDGTNDAPALAQADVGVAMNTGTMAAKEAGNMVDLDSNPTKLIEIVAIGKQLLITRGALTTFSIANDVAKYFAIIPAMFMATYPALNALNIMHLHTPQSAVLAAVIFNALIIIALVPLALRGVKYRPESAAAYAAQKPVDLRIGRHYCAFPRHLADRPAAGFVAPRVGPSGARPCYAAEPSSALQSARAASPIQRSGPCPARAERRSALPRRFHALPTWSSISLHALHDRSYRVDLSRNRHGLLPTSVSPSRQRQPGGSQREDRGLQR